MTEGTYINDSLHKLSTDIINIITKIIKIDDKCMLLLPYDIELYNKENKDYIYIREFLLKIEKCNEQIEEIEKLKNDSSYIIKFSNSNFALLLKAVKIVDLSKFISLAFIKIKFFDIILAVRG